MGHTFQIMDFPTILVTSPPPLPLMLHSSYLFSSFKALSPFSFCMHPPAPPHLNPRKQPHLVIYIGSGIIKACLLKTNNQPLFDPWFGRIPWRKKWQFTPVFLPGESLQTEELGGLYIAQRVTKCQTQLSNWAHAVIIPQCKFDEQCKSITSTEKRWLSLECWP